MPWGKCDDKFWNHIKVRALDDSLRLAAVGLYWRAISWCNDALTDGLLSERDVEYLDGTPELVSELVSVGMWERDGEGYRVHDYLHFNFSRDHILKDRERKSAIGKKGAEARWGWGKEWEPFLAAWSERFDKPPTDKQREMLWPVIDARPTDAAKWLRSAPVSRPFDAVEHVVSRWRGFVRKAA